MTDWQTLDQQYIMHTVRRLPIAISHAKGNYLIDTNGNRYLDLFTGLAVNILGHSHPKLMEALQKQGNRFLHISNLFLNPPAIRLAERLVRHTFGQGKVYFTNSGAESTEALIKLIHKWTQKTQIGREGIVVLKNSFHGRTLGALRLTRQPSVYQDFPQPLFPIYEIEPNDTQGFIDICQQHDPAAVLVEPILGAGGVIPLDQAFLQTLDQVAEEKNLLFCVDEIQTGMGRTGTLFAYQALNLTPDVILFAKGIGGGLPLGGIIASSKVQDTFAPGDHGTTFAPSPLSASLGNAVLDVLLEDGMMEQGRKNAEYLWSHLMELKKTYPKQIRTIQGRGMMVGIHMLLPTEQVLQIQTNLLRNGFLVNVTSQTVIRLLPPLTLTQEEIDSFITALGDEIQSAVTDENRRDSL